jgi:hypothetical protein
MDGSGDWVAVAAMLLVYGLYKLDLWRRARRVDDFAAEARRKVRDAAQNRDS